MTLPRWVRGPFPRRGPTVGAILLALVVPVLLVPAAAASDGAVPGWTDGAVSWTNGTVLCEFNPGSPGVTASSPALSQTGLSVGLSSIEEVNATGGTPAVASMYDATWLVTNLSSDDAFDLAFSSQVPLVDPVSQATVGSASVEVQFVLPAYAGADSGSVNQVTLEVGVSNWTWQASGDTLALLFPIAPAFPDHEQLIAPTAGGATVRSLSTQTGDPLETFTAATNATVVPPGGPSTLVAAAPTFTIQPELGFVTLAIGNASTGSFQSMNYTAVVNVVGLPSTVLGLPLYDYALVAGGAGFVCVVVAAGVRRVRQRTSDLIYVEDDE